jgi:hypothetical protein
MKLTIEKLAPYLPYGLEMLCIINDSTYTLEGLKESSIRLYENGKGINGQEYWSDYFDFKPILRPLTDLTKEIEVKEKTYYEELLEIYPSLDNKLSIEEGYCDLDQYIRILEYLYKNHFDVNGLIPEGLAIDINTL